MLRALAVALSLLAVLVPTAATTQSGPVKVGLLLPYTGPLSIQGQDTTKGFELYLAKLGGKVAGREIQVLKEVHRA